MILEVLSILKGSGGLWIPLQSPAPPSPHTIPTQDSSTASLGWVGQGRQERAASGLTAHFLFTWSYSQEQGHPRNGDSRGNVLLRLIPVRTRGLSGFYQSTAPTFPCSFIGKKHVLAGSCRALRASRVPVSQQPHLAGVLPCRLCPVWAQCPPCQSRLAPTPKGGEEKQDWREGKTRG